MKRKTPWMENNTRKLRPSNDIINELIEIEENAVSLPLDAIQESQHIKRREEILIELGRRAFVGNNQYTEGKLTTRELARQSGYTARTYQYKKAIAKMNEEAQDLLWKLHSQKI